MCVYNFIFIAIHIYFYLQFFSHSHQSIYKPYSALQDVYRVYSMTLVSVGVTGCSKESIRYFKGTYRNEKSSHERSQMTLYP